MPYTAAAEETRVDDPRIGAASNFRIPQNASVFLPTNDDDDDLNDSDDDQDVDEDDEDDDDERGCAVLRYRFGRSWIGTNS